MFRFHPIVLIVFTAPLAACASVSVTALDYHGKPKPGEAKGIRYYMPKPYLLVAEVPDTKQTTNGQDTPPNNGTGTTRNYAAP